MKCEKCGAAMKTMHEESGTTIKCPNCGWNIATTMSLTIVEDETDYSIYICGSYKANIERLKAVSEIVGGNFLDAKRYLSGEIKAALIHGEALIRNSRNQLRNHANVSLRFGRPF